ncbi:MAG TPA: PAS domain S-box protein [Humisphaera sp.]
MDDLADPCFRVDTGWIIRWANPAAEALLRRQVEPAVGASARAVFPDAFGATFDRQLGRALRLGLPACFEDQYLPLDTWLEVRLYPDPAGATVLIHDVADRRRGSERLEDQTKLLEQIARGGSTADVLEAVTGFVERHGSGLLCGVYETDLTSPRLRLAAAPGLPAEYAQAVAEPDLRPDGPPAAQAAFTGKRAAVADLLTDPVDPQFKQDATKHGFRAAAAVPVLSPENAVLGVVAVWRREPGLPTPQQEALLKSATHLAGIALERRRAEADLREKEQESRAIVETVQDGLVVVDAQGFVAEANPAACRLHGSTRDALVGRPAADLVRADYHGVLRRLLDDVRRGREFHGELACTRKDGSSFAAEVTAVALAFKGQRHVLTMVRDVSGRKRVEENLRRSEDRLRTVANGAPLVLFSLDRSGVFTLSEGQALAAIGLRAGDVVGKSAFDLYGHDPVITENLRMALSGEPRRWVAEIGERVFETTARPIRSARGEIVGVSGVAVDVTEQTFALAALRESEERFRASFHQSPIAVAHAGLDGRIIRANDRLAALLGTRVDELVGRRVSEWYAPPGPQADDEAVRSLLAGERHEAARIQPFRAPDGSTGRATVSLALVRGRGGEPRHLIVLMTPIDGNW